MKKVKAHFLRIIASVLAIAALLSAYGCSGTGSSSGKKWSDLSPQEQANAKWAYEAQQAINGKK